jgi:hypothetical protein
MCVHLQPGPWLETAPASALVHARNPGTPQSLGNQNAAPSLSRTLQLTTWEQGVLRVQLQVIVSPRRQLPATSIFRAPAEQVASSLLEQPNTKRAKATIHRVMLPIMS